MKKSGAFAGGVAARHVERRRVNFQFPVIEQSGNHFPRGVADVAREVKVTLRDEVVGVQPDRGKRFLYVAMVLRMSADEDPEATPTSWT